MTYAQERLRSRPDLSEEINQCLDVLGPLVRRAGNDEEKRKFHHLRASWELYRIKTCDRTNGSQR